MFLKLDEFNKACSAGKVQANEATVKNMKIERRLNEGMPRRARHSRTWHTLSFPVAIRGPYGRC